MATPTPNGERPHYASTDSHHRGSFPDLHDIPAALHALHNAAVPRAGIISIYLDTGGGRSRRRAYLAAFRNARKRAAGQLVASELPGFDSAAARADWFLEHLFVPRHPGLALFAAGDVEYLYTVPLPQPPEEFVGWDTRPLLAPLEATLDDHERVALAIFDRRRIRLFTLFLGALEEHRVLPCQPMCGNADTATDGVLKVDWACSGTPWVRARKDLGGPPLSAEWHRAARSRTACSYTPNMPLER